MILVDKRFSKLIDQSWVDQRGYVWCYTGQVSHGIKLHRVIMETSLMRRLSRKEEVDHIDGNRLNNQLSNLRLANRSENMRNQRRPNKGIRLTKEGRWQARISINKKQICLGTFLSKQQAAAAYNAASKNLHGQFGQPTEAR